MRQPKEMNLTITEYFFSRAVTKYDSTLLSVRTTITKTICLCFNYRQQKSKTVFQYCVLILQRLKICNIKPTGAIFYTLHKFF